VPDATTPVTRPAPSMASLARPSGAFAMLAMDQRVSLETMFRNAGRDTSTATLDAFRGLVLDAAAPHVSAILLERGYLERAGVGSWAGRSTGRIVAADDLQQPAGMPAQDSTLDREAAALAVTLDADALKLLVIWLSGAGAEKHARQAAMVGEFVQLAHAQGMLALVEVIAHGGVRAGERPVTADELLAAAAALGPGSDIYKAQVPIHGGDSAADVERLAREMTAAVRVPWVVLSTGVSDDRFPELVGASCRGGASGFLAGRAIWSRAVPAVTTSEAEVLLRTSAADLGRLGAIVDAEARPYTEVFP
jgi:sulfofructosephosphate aldolase